MANEYLTVKQAQYLLDKWKQEAIDDYVAKSGDTMTGNLAIRRANPQFMLELSLIHI